MLHPSSGGCSSGSFTTPAALLPPLPPPPLPRLLLLLLLLPLRFPNAAQDLSCSVDEKCRNGHRGTPTQEQVPKAHNRDAQAGVGGDRGEVGNGTFAWLLMVVVVVVVVVMVVADVVRGVEGAAAAAAIGVPGVSAACRTLLLIAQHGEPIPCLPEGENTLS